MERMTAAGFPPTRVSGGTSLVTTEPAATTEFSPTVTPPMIVTPAATIAQLICAFANTKGGAIVLGVVEQEKTISINGLSDEFRAVPITRKAIDLLTPAPVVSYDYIHHGGKRLFLIEVAQSANEISFGGKAFVRTGDRTTPKQAIPVKPLTELGIEKLRKALADDRKACTEARAKMLDHYESVLRILDDLGILQQWAKSESAASAFAFEPDAALAFNAANDQMKGFEGDRLFLGMNPAPGATLAYRLKADAKDVKWSIRDSGGTVMRELTGTEVCN